MTVHAASDIGSEADVILLAQHKSQSAAPAGQKAAALYLLDQSGPCGYNPSKATKRDESVAPATLP